MKTNTIKNISILLLVFFSCTIDACKKDFLDVADKTVIVRQAYVTDLNTTSHYLNGIYSDLSVYFLNGYGLIYPEVIADNIKPEQSMGSFLDHYSWKQYADESRPSALVPSDPNSNGLWAAGYKIIRSCSFVIEVVDQYRKENEEKADNIKGQALALRAFAHFILTNTFAQPYNFTSNGNHPGIPYVKTSDWSVPITRQTVSEVYDNMVDDLNASLSLLPANSSPKYIINLNAAKALLARVYLFKEDFTAAKDLSKQVLDAVPVMLNNYPQKLYTDEETEALFQLPPSPSHLADGYFTEFAGLYFTSDYQLQFLATNDIAALLREEPNDKRGAWVTLVSGKWHITKFPNSLVESYPIPAGAYYQTVIRSSEMCLTAAEAYAKLNNEDSARLYLNAIRKRANPSAGNSMESGSALIEAIYKERRKELAFDGLRMFDLLRWKKGVNRNDILNGTASTLPYPSDKAIAPIPNQDVTLAGLKQNTGY